MKKSLFARVGFRFARCPVVPVSCLAPVCLPAFSLLLAVAVPSAPAATTAPPFVYEAERELAATGDFDGDGRQDIVIVDRGSGKVRLGYQLSDGIFNWADWRPSGLKDVTGLTVGKLVDANHDALAFASADANLVTVLDVSGPAAPASPVKVPVSVLGPSAVVAMGIGGPGNTPLHDLYLGSIYNSDPTPNRGTLFRNDGIKFSQLAEVTLSGAPARANRIALKSGQPEVMAMLVSEEKGAALRVESLSSGKSETAITVANLPAGSDYAVGNFRGSPLCEFVFYTAGGSNLTVRPVEEPSPGKFQVGAGNSFSLGQPIKQLIAVPNGGSKLLVIFDKGETAGVFNFDGASAPALAQSLETPTNELVFGAAALPNGLVVLSSPAVAKASTRYQVYKFNGKTYDVGIFGSLASLADTDDVTVPDIHKRIAANLKEKSEADMKAYTNTIPGTDASYSMVPIPGGEFVLGSPDNERERKKDEGPQHKVKISPFWMGQFEVTWNEYQVFMYPDDEKRMRESAPADPAVDGVSDAVTRPSRPYVDMSFGMGKERCPAISMTQHAANKYCHWLSARTGHFYRLPTEAEWEYACRAGTTTTYFFGDDPKQLKDYAWFFDNSDSKYQKVGRKKPNPWGLYDICGNVLEWCLDQYEPDYYKTSADKGVVMDPWDKATQPYPHSARGGSWDDDPPALRSAARRGSDRTWKMTDPQLPKSIWYHSDAQFIGFRIVRPLKVPPPEEMVKYWTSGVEKD